MRVSSMGAQTFLSLADAGVVWARRLGPRPGRALVRSPQAKQVRVVRMDGHPVLLGQPWTSLLAISSLAFSWRNVLAFMLSRPTRRSVAPLILVGPVCTAFSMVVVRVAPRRHPAMGSCESRTARGLGIVENSI